MAPREQYPFRQVAPGVDVVGWGAHRYQPAIVGLSPAHVDLNIDAGDGAVTRLTVSFGCKEARALAAAILVAADRAEQAPEGEEAFRELAGPPELAP